MPDAGDGLARRGLGGGGALLLAGGLSILSPGWKDAALAFLNRKFDLDLYLDVPPLVGGVLVFTGVAFLLLAFFGPARLSRAAAHFFGASRRAGPVVALREIGFAPAVRSITPEELPPRLAGRELQHLVVDVSHELSANPPQLQTALEKQLRVADQIAGLLGAQPDAQLALCGIIQAPFQFLVGHQLSTWVGAQVFEWDRHAHRWQALQGGNGPDLQAASRAEAVGQGADVAIAIEVSFAISTADIIRSVPALMEIVRIGPANPRLDCVTHEGQVTALARLFRAELDRLHAQLPGGARVHVFVAAPMSVGFGLGRMISRTLHPPVGVYAYVRNAQPPYRWGLDVNTPAGAPQVLWN